MINGQYWINTDAYVDIERLKGIELDIIKGLCLTIPFHNIVVYGSNVAEPNWITAKNSLLQSNDQTSQAFKELLDSPRALNARKLFTKLTHGVYSGGTSVTVRIEKDYQHKNFRDYCRNTPESEHFPSLLSYVASLPFSEIGRIVIFLNDHGLATPIHTDGFPEESHRHEFLWFSTNLTKKFFVYDPLTNEKHYVTSYSAFFNEQDYHGSEPAPVMNFSFRVDGVFTDEFREQLGIAHVTNYNSKE